jgi:cytochrome c peroxidase
MRGKGNFDDSRLDDAAQFPIAAANHFGHVHNSPDRITSNLPALHLYQLSIRAPAPPSNSFDHTAADRGRELFSGKARCTTCHADPVFTEPGWNMHKASESVLMIFKQIVRPIMRTEQRLSTGCGPTPRVATITMAASPHWPRL